MAAPTSYANTERWLEDINEKARQLFNLLKAGIDVGQSGQLGDLALVNTLSDAPIGDLVALQQALQVRNVAGRALAGNGSLLMTDGYAGIGSTGRELTSAIAPVNLKALGKGIYIANRPVNDNVTGLPSYIPGADYSAHIPLTGSSPASPINSVLSFIPLQKRIVWGLSDGTETGLMPIEVYTAGSILGPVSFQAGTPSGALFERGSNSLGSYKKTADGSQLCTVLHSGTYDVNTSGYGLYRSSPITITLPRSFARTSTMTISVEMNTGSGAALGVWVGRTRVVSPNSIEVYLLSAAASAGVAVNFSVEVNGEWT